VKSRNACPQKRRLRRVGSDTAESTCRQSGRSLKEKIRSGLNEQRQEFINRAIEQRRTRLTSVVNCGDKHIEQSSTDLISLLVLQQKFH